jgi:hypothetical protein
VIANTTFNRSRMSLVHSPETQEIKEKETGHRIQDTGYRIHLPSPVSCIPSLLS